VLKPYLQHGRAINRQQTFWRSIGQGPQPFATSSNKKEGLQ